MKKYLHSQLKLNSKHKSFEGVFFLKKTPGAKMVKSTFVLLQIEYSLCEWLRIKHIDAHKAYDNSDTPHSVPL